MVEGKEIKQYKNIEIPDELKKLEYQDFKFDVPLNGEITFMFEPGVLSDVFPQTRERRTRKTKAQEAQQQEAAAAETEYAEPQQEAQYADSLPDESVEALAQALEDAQAADEPVGDLANTVANDEAIKAEISGDEAMGRVLVITAESGSTETMAQSDSDVPTKKPG